MEEKAQGGLGMARVSSTIVLTPAEKDVLEKTTRSHCAAKRDVLRASIILLASQGLQNKVIAEELDVSEKVVAKWRNRFAQYQLAGLRDSSGRGRPKVFSGDDTLTVIRAACERPDIESHWSIRSLQKKLQKDYHLEMSTATLQRVLADLDLKPHLCESWLESRDPEFEAKQTQIVGLYLNPPENALVISVDEKTGIQALGRPEPSKPMRPGYVEKVDAHYQRNGTQSLLAALLVHEGKVMGQCYDRHTNEEFIDFMEEVVKHHPDKDLYVILDNLSVHKHQNVKTWLAKHKDRVHFVFTPTRASWLNQIELWFGILTRKVLKRGIFDSTEELVCKIMGFIEQYNKDAKPFRWTYTGEPLKR